MLHPDFLTRPIAHRGLHGPGAPENSAAAFQAAIAGGHAIELDVQPAADGTPLVFHDETLERMTGVPGPVSGLSAAQAARLRLAGTQEGIPALADVLELVAGRVPLLIEIKDQDGALGPQMGDLPRAVAGLLEGYGGAVAVMSFNPHAAAMLARAAPAIPVGLTSCAFAQDDWPDVAPQRRARLARLADFDGAGACFVSHHHLDLDNPALAALRARGVPVLCWTIRSAEEERAARRGAANITYEGYAPCAS